MSSTVRRLIVLRHAESEGEVDGKGDHARTLSARGRREAARIGLQLRARGWVPQVVVSSDAARTRETWASMQPALAGAPTVIFTRALYLMGIDEIRAVLREQDPAVDTVMVLGHNPGWEDAIHALSGVRGRMAPCTAALLQTTAGSWAEAAARTDWALDTLLRPDRA
jgi:phosphohistidine phosphatase